MRFLVPFFLIIVLGGIITAQVKTPQQPAVKTPFAQSLQTIVVTTKDWSATQGTAYLFERKSRNAKWVAFGDGLSFPVVIGRSGLAWDSNSAPKAAAELKKEGDGKSPAGMFPLTFSFGTAEKTWGLKIPFKKLEEFTECVDDVNSSHYNKVVDRMQVGDFDWKSSEKMAEIKPEYDIGVFVAYNSYPQIKGNGSCIFLHIWKDENTPTSGCTAMSRSYLETTVGWLDAGKNPYLIQMPEDEYSKYRKKWKLPKLK